MSLDMNVKPICLNSFLTVKASETRIRVPSERTTRSSGTTRKANGSLMCQNKLVSKDVGMIS